MKSIGQLYVRGRIINNTNECEVPIETLICSFVLLYCDIEIDVYIVDAEDLYIHKVSLDAFSSIHKLKFIKHVEKQISSCCLPAIEVKEENICIAGVCAVLRWIIKNYSEIHPNHHSKSLLGFRGGCLSACAESSMLTKFCELQIPDAAKELAVSVRKESKNLKIPSNLFILEAHLKQPVRTHNILKRKLDIVKKTKDSYSKNSSISSKETLDDCVEENLLILKENKNSDILCNIPEKLNNMKITEKSENLCLNHCYLEGIDLTLADMTSFPCVHYILCKLPLEGVKCLANVSRWYEKIITNPRIKDAANKCHFFDIQPEKNWNFKAIESMIDDVKTNQISLYARDVSHTRLRSRKYNPSQILTVLEDAKISPSFRESFCTQLKWDNLPVELHPATGDLPEKRVARKCQQIESIVTAVLQIAKNGQTIVEFCAGGGHVGLLLAYHLPTCKIVLVENKESSMIRARSRAKILGLNNISFFQCNLDYFKGTFDIGVSLHACGVATDLVIQQCLLQKSAFVCCPCCYGGVQNTHLLSYPLSKKFATSGLSNQDYTLLAHCADRNELNTPTAKQGELCMGLIDMDRVYNAEENGYHVVLSTLQPPSCSPKHNLLIGTPLMRDHTHAPIN